MDDEALISRFLDGDSGVIAQVRGWLRAAFGPYRSRLAPDLEDLEQEILMDLTTALRGGRFHRQSRLRTYVRTYAHHKCIDRIRAHSRRQWLDIEELDLPAPAPSALDRLSKAENTEMALRVVEEMPESCRELWRMLQQGMRYREMGRHLGIAEGTLRARVLRCRRRAVKLRARFLSQVGGNETRSSTTE